MVGWLDGWMDGTVRLKGRFELDLDGELSIIRDHGHAHGSRRSDLLTII